MKQLFGAVCVAILLSCLGSPARSEDAKGTDAILDKAIKALGGEEKLKAVKAVTWKTKSTINFNGMDNEFTSQATVEGLDHSRSEFESGFGKGVTVVKGDKAWRKFGDNNNELEKDLAANEKRIVYLQIIPTTILPLKDKSFKIEVAKEDKVDGKAAVGLKITPPDGKEFTLYFAKESGLPVKQVAKVLDFMGTEYTQETTFDKYKDFKGIQKATKIASKRDGEKFIESEITEFKVLDKVDPKTFDQPE